MQIRKVRKMQMTIDEAIKNAGKLAELNEEQAQIYREQDDIIGAWSYEECAKEHRQLAEWLRELKAYREARNEITRKMNSGQWSEVVVYGLDKAVRIMEKHLREVKADADSD